MFVPIIRQARTQRNKPRQYVLAMLGVVGESKGGVGWLGLGYPIGSSDVKERGRVKLEQWK